MGRQIPGATLGRLGVDEDEAPARRERQDRQDRGQHDVALERIEWAVMQRRPAAGRGPGISLSRRREVQLSQAARQLMGVTVGTYIGVGWDAQRRHIVIRRVPEGDPRAGRLHKGGYIGRQAGRFLEARGFRELVFYPGEARDGSLTVPAPAAGGGRAAS